MRKVIATFLLICMFCISHIALTQGNFLRKTNWPNSYKKTDILINAIACSPKGSIFISTKSGIFCSDDRGESWRKIVASLAGPDIGTIAINSKGYIFANSGGMNGLFRSLDNGKHWTLVSSMGFVKCIGISKDDHVFVANSIYVEVDKRNKPIIKGGGLYVSKDDGNTWKELTNMNYSNVNDIAFNSLGHIIVGTKFDGIVCSKDNGTTWSQSNSGWPANNSYPSDALGVVALAINPVGYLYASTSLNGLIRSVNNGESWEEITKSRFMFLTINSIGHIYVNMRPTGVFLSKDNGITWTQFNTSLRDDDILDIAVDFDDYIFIITWRDVFRSEFSTSK